MKERSGATEYGAEARVMACTPWCSRQRSSRAELSGVDAVALHLDVQRLVIDPEESRRLTLVSQRGLKGQSNRLPLRFGDGTPGDLPQGGPLVSSFTVRSR